MANQCDVVHYTAWRFTPGLMVFMVVVQCVLGLQGKHNDCLQSGYCVGFLPHHTPSQQHT